MKPLGLVMLLGLVATSCQSGPAANSPSPTGSSQITIASDFPTSGFPAPDILPLRRAIQLAIRQHPTVGRFSLNYLSLDDFLGGKPNPDQGVRNVNQMVANAQVLAMIGPRQSTVAYAEIPVANAADLVMVSPSNTNACLTLAAPYCNPEPAALRPSGRNNYFRISPPDTAQGTAMARYAADALNIRKAAAFSEWRYFGDTAITDFAEELARRGGQLVLWRDIPPGTTEFSSFLKEAAALDVQAIYAVTDGDNPVCAARAQMKTILPLAYFLGNDSVADEQCIKDAGDNTGLMFTTSDDFDVTQSNDPAAKEFVRAYTAAYPETKGIPAWAAAAYDCALIVINAIESAVKANNGEFPTRRQVLDFVAHSKVKGVSGTYSFDGNGDATSPLMSIYQVKGGKWAYVQQLDVSA